MLRTDLAHQLERGEGADSRRACAHAWKRQVDGLAQEPGQLTLARRPPGSGEGLGRHVDHDQQKQQDVETCDEEDAADPFLHVDIVGRSLNHELA